MTTQSEAWIPADTFARRLVDIRHERHLTVEQAAEACNIPAATWSTWERGSIPRNMPAIVAKIVLGLRVNRDWLMWGSLTATTDQKPSRSRRAQQPPAFPLAEAV